jgi:putative transcriptional regulator
MTKMFDTLMTGLDEVEAFLAGERLKMTQARFSDTFGFSLDAVKHWEGGRRTPESSARAFLTVIARNPTAVVAALHSVQKRARNSAVRSRSRS